MIIFVFLYFLLLLVFISYLIDTTLVKNYKIVKFSNESYGLRRGYYWFKYKDLNGGYWWYKGDGYFSECQGTLEQVRKIKSRFTDIKETVIE